MTFMIRMSVFEYRLYHFLAFFGFWTGRIASSVTLMIIIIPTFGDHCKNYNGVQNYISTYLMIGKHIERY